MLELESFLRLELTASKFVVELESTGREQTPIGKTINMVQVRLRSEVLTSELDLT